MLIVGGLEKNLIQAETLILSPRRSERAPTLPPPPCFEYERVKETRTQGARDKHKPPPLILLKIELKLEVGKKKGRSTHGLPVDLCMYM